MKVFTNCGQVFDGEVIVNKACVTVEGGQIVSVGEAPVALDAETIDVGGRLLTPGLIDAHTHAVYAGSRANEFAMRCLGATYQEIAAEGGGIRATVRAVRAVSEDLLFQESLKHVQRMLSCGTTTAEVKSGYGLDAENELKMLRVADRLDKESPLDVVTTFLGCHAVPEAFASSADFTEHVCEVMLPRVVEQGIASAMDMFVESGYFSHADAERLAGTLALPLRLHVDQFSQGGAQLAARLEARTADHLEQTAEDGMLALKRSGTIPVLLPGSVYALGLKKHPDARKMLDFGLPVVLATDFNPGSSPTPSLPMVMSLACTQMGLTPLESFVACTSSAARALGLNDRGRISPGAKADFVVWDTDDLREVPYYFGANLVHSVYKDDARVVGPVRS